MGAQAAKESNKDLVKAVAKCDMVRPPGGSALRPVSVLRVCSWSVSCEAISSPPHGLRAWALAGASAG